MPREINIARASIGFFANVDSFVRNLTKADKAVRQQQIAMRRLRTTLRNTGRQLQRNIEAIGRWVTTWGLAGLTIGGSGVLGQFRKFDDALVRLRSLIGLSGETVENFRTELLALGPELGKAPVELAEGLFFLSSAGLRGDEALRALTAASKASSIGLGSVEQVSEALTSALGSWGREALSVEQATSILLATVREGRFAPEQLAAEIGRLGVLAAELGVTFDELGGTLAFLSRSQDLQTASTGIRGLLTTLIKPSEQARDALEQAGLSVNELRQRVDDDGLLEALTFLRQRFRENGVELSKLFARVDGLNTVLALTGVNADTARQVFEALARDSASGAAELNRAFNELSESPGFRLDLAFQQINLVALEFAQNVVPRLAVVLTKIAENIDLVVHAFQLLVVFMISRGWVGRFVRNVTQVIIKTFNWRTALTALTGTMKAVEAQTTVFSARIIATSKRIGAAIATMSVAFVNAVRTMTIQVRTRVVLMAEGFAETIATMAGRVRARVVLMAEGFAETITTMAGRIRARVVLMAEGFAEAITTMAGRVRARVVLMAESFIGSVVAMSTRIRAAVASMTTTFAAGITTMATRIRTGIIPATMAFVTILTGMGLRVRTIMAGMTASFSVGFARIGATIAASRGIFTGFAASLTSVLVGLRASVASTAAAIGGGLTTAINTATAALARFRASVSAGTVAVTALRGAGTALAYTMGGALATGITAANIALKAFLVTTKALVRFVVPLAALLALFEAIVIAFEFIVNLARQAQGDLSITFGELATVAGVQFLGKIIEVLLGIVPAMLRIFEIAVRGVINFVGEAGAIIGRRLWNAVVNPDALPDDSVWVELGNALARSARDAIDADLFTDIIPTFDGDAFADATLKALGFDDTKLNAAKELVDNALKETAEDIKARFGLVADEAGQGVDNLETAAERIARFGRQALTTFEQTFLDISRVSQFDFSDSVRALENFAGSASERFDDVGAAARELGRVLRSELVSTIDSEAVDRIIEEWEALLEALPEDAERASQLVLNFWNRAFSELESGFQTNRQSLERFSEQGVVQIRNIYREIGDIQEVAFDPEYLQRFSQIAVGEFDNVKEAAIALGQIVTGQLTQRFGDDFMDIGRLWRELMEQLPEDAERAADQVLEFLLEMLTGYRDATKEIKNFAESSGRDVERLFNRITQLSGRDLDLNPLRFFVNTAAVDFGTVEEAAERLGEIVLKRVAPLVGSGFQQIQADWERLRASLSEDPELAVEQLRNFATDLLNDVIGNYEAIDSFAQRSAADIERRLISIGELSGKAFDPSSIRAFGISAVRGFTSVEAAAQRLGQIVVNEIAPRFGQGASQVQADWNTLLENLSSNTEVAQGQIEGFLNDLLSQLEDNYRDINTFAENAVSGLVETYRSIAELSGQTLDTSALKQFAQETSQNFNTAQEAAIALGNIVVNDLAGNFGVASRSIRADWQEVLANLSADPEEAVAQIQSFLDRASQGVDDFYENLANQNRRTVESIGNAFGEFAGSVVKDFNNLSDAARRLGQAIIDALVNRFITEPISNAATNAISNLFGIQGEAQHGGVHQGLTLVGEVGPEIVDFRNPSRVYTNTQLSSALSQQGGKPLVNINLSVNSDNPEFVYQAIADATPALRDVIKSDLALELSRPSAIGSAIRGY